MQYIVLDIEFNGRKFASELPMEVIEIGAVRLDEQLQTVDSFTSLIKPVYFSKLNPFIRKKTGIPQEEIDRAPSFPAVNRAFQAWLNKSGPYVLLTWGGEDLKRIVQDTRMHKLDDQYWLAASYLDLLKAYLRQSGQTNDVSVENAMEQLLVTNTWNAHRALDDAHMTAEVFRRIAEKIDWSYSQHYKDMHTNAKERRLLKQLVRTMMTQKVVLSWEQFAAQLLAGKIQFADLPKKEAELRELYEAECAKPPRERKQPASARAGKGDHSRQAQQQSKQQMKPQANPQEKPVPEANPLQNPIQEAAAPSTSPVSQTEAARQE